MQKIYDLIAVNRKLVIVITYAYIAISGYFSFPINTEKRFLLLVLIFILYFYIAHILYGLYKKRTLYVFCSTLLLNSIGLLCRVLIEWGEYSITRNLTPVNIGIHLISIPVFMTVVYSILTYRRVNK